MHNLPTPKQPALMHVLTKGGQRYALEANLSTPHSS